MSAAEPRRRPIARWAPVTALTAVLLAVAIVGLGLARIATGGWAALAPDDARYLFVGLSILDGQGAVTASGNPYLLRAPVYGLALALGGQVGGDPLVGARAVALVLALLGLLAATRIGWLAAGPGGAAGTAIALVATPLVWQLLPSLRIDLPQTTLVLVLVLVAWRPTIRRWAAAGVVLGLVVLVKETVLPLLLLPVALVGFVPPQRLALNALAYVGAAVATAGWWWVVVWAGTGTVFPANALAIIEARDVEAARRVAWAAVGLVAVFGCGWAVTAWRARRELGPRLLVVAAIGLAPAAAYAAIQDLNARNFAGLGVLSAVAIGMAGATVVAEARRRIASGSRAGGRPVALAAAVVLAAVIAFVVVGPVVGQRAVPRTPHDRLADDLVAWIDANVATGGRIVMAFREREEMAVRRFGRTEVGLVGVRRVDPADDPGAFVWMGLRDRQLFGYRRTDWVAALTNPPARYLVLVAPHPFTPVELASGSAGGPSMPGLTAVATLDRAGDRAVILRIDPGRVALGTPDVPLHLSADAALAWLDGDGRPDAVDRLLGAGPVVSGESLPALLARLGDRACGVGAPGGARRMGPAGSCPP